MLFQGGTEDGFRAASPYPHEFVVSNTNLVSAGARVGGGDAAIVELLYQEKLPSGFDEQRA